MTVMVSEPLALRTADDHALVRRIAAGENEAVVALYRQHARELYRFIHRLSNGCTEDAEEILQDTMLAACSGALRFRGDCSVRTWLYSIARRQVLQRQRTDLRKKRSSGTANVPLDESLLETLRVANQCGEALPSEIAHLAEVKEMVNRILSELDDDGRHLLLMRYVEGLSNREISVVFGRSERAVEGMLRRTRLRARAIGETYLR